MEFIAPTLCVLFGAALALLAPVARYLRHLFLVGSAFILIGVALFIDIGSQAAAESLTRFINDMLYVIAAQLLVEGVTRKSGRTFPFLWHATVFVLLTSTIAWFAFIQPDLIRR